MLRFNLKIMIFYYKKYIIFKKTIYSNNSKNLEKTVLFVPKRVEKLDDLLRLGIAAKSKGFGPSKNLANLITKMNDFLLFLKT